ncbi:translocation protein sec62 [Piptocephalis cylindrospora]|uniref:Translocation protein SEC62 n=1 Tax=Piptocephalis cylindrospora TaxID=1907219 RepID=A0A4P9Y4M5_9FUNG|nr:translocation protein sec62 [Piptocephalis cylindrospora]|eukprot:RKP13833.1 translocation protein sec62 [Piptocephalis cylindrospora]
MSSPAAPQPPKELVSVANFLRNSGTSGLRARSGVLDGKRVDFFKGKSAFKALTKDAYAKASSSHPSVNSPTDARNVLQRLLDERFFFRCECTDQSISSGTRVLQPVREQRMVEDGYYVWIYQGSQIGMRIASFGLVALVFAGVMFPLWPQFMREGAWYVSVAILGLLGALFGLAIIRLIIYVISLPILPVGFWLFPNLFADCGFFESFVPLYGWDESEKKVSKRAQKQPADSEDAKEE